VRRLQSVSNASAWLIYATSDALVSVHWLLVPERIQHKVAVLTCKVLHDTAPRYLGPLDEVADLPGRRALHSASTSRLVLPSFRLSTVGSRTFNVSAALKCTGLEDVVSAPSLSTFRRRLKTFLFQQSDCTFGSIVVLEVILVI